MQWRAQTHALGFIVRAEAVPSLSVRKTRFSRKKFLGMGFLVIADHRRADRKRPETMDKTASRVPSRFASLITRGRPQTGSSKIDAGSDALSPIIVGEKSF